MKLDGMIETFQPQSHPNMGYAHFEQESGHQAAISMKHSCISTQILSGNMIKKGSFVLYKPEEWNGSLPQLGQVEAIQTDILSGETHVHLTKWDVGSPQMPHYFCSVSNKGTEEITLNMKVS